MSGKISGIYVEIRGDASQLKKELASARQLVTEQAQGMSNALNNALSPQQLKGSVNGLVRNLNQLSQASKLTGSAFNGIGADLGQLQRLTGITEQQFQSLQSKMLQTSAAKAQEQALRNIAKAASLTSAEIRSLGQQMGVGTAGISNVIGQAESVGSSMSLLAGGAKTVAAAFGVLSGVMITQQLVEFGRAVIDTGIAVDSLNRSFVAIFDGAGNAAREFDFVRKVALDTGQSFYTIADSYKQISASAKDTVLEGEEARKLFLAMASAGSVLGLSNERMQLSFKAFSDMMSKGQVQMEELKNQLGDNLPGALNIAARGMGITRAEVIALAKDGKLLASEVIPAMTQELQRMYGEAAQTASLESGRAAVNRLSDAWTDLKANLFDNAAFVSVTNALANMTKAASGMFGAISLGNRYVAAQDNLRGLEQIEGTPMATLPGFSSKIAAARKEVALLKAQLDAVANPLKADSWLSRDKGAMFADERSAGALEAIDKGRQKMLEYIQTAKEKAAVERDTHLEFARNQEERDAILKKYAGTIAALDSKALKSSETAANKAASAKAKALKEAMERNALEPYEITQLEKMNQGDMIWGKAAADKRGEDMARDMVQENLQLQTEFSEKYREIVLGETEFKLDQIRLQGEAYVKAGSDEVAVAQWVAAEKLKVSRDWADGVKRGLQDYADSATNTAALAENAITNGFQGMEDALVSFVTTGKMEFEDLANSIISDLARIAVQQSITGPIANMLGGADWSSLFGGGGPSVASIGAPKVGYAKGGVPGAEGLHAYANTVVSRPTIFPFAKGVGLMGEDGPEAIMPLKRGPDGSLGVQGGGSNVVVNVIESPGKGGQQQQRQEGGATIIDVMVEQIESKIASNINRNSGPIPQALGRSYNMRRSPGAY